MKQPVPHKDVGPKTKLAAVRWHQKQYFLHPLTCGNDSSHQILEGHMTDEGTAYLGCNDCGYVQPIPDHIWQLFIGRMSGAIASYG